MTRRASLAILTFALAGFAAWASLTPMAFWMGSAQMAYRDAQVVAFSTAASDYEVQAECQYVASVDAYAWGLNPDLAPPYDSAPMILFGNYNGGLLAHKFTPRAGLAEQIQWQAIPLPSTSIAGRTVTLSWVIPIVEAGTVADWKLVVDGVAQALPSQPHAVTLAPGNHSFALRAVMVGSPQPHQATGQPARVVIK